MPRTIFLVGFMGAGKTTFGKKLAKKLQLEFVDLDEAVCAAYGYPSVTALVDERGIDFFREAESKILREIDLADKVISTGGGTPCYYDSMTWMKSKGTVIYLELDEKTLYNRLRQSDMNERPLLKGLDDAGLQQFIHDKLAERLPYYTQAHISFNPLKGKVEELVGTLQ